jgi:hypothetical protein
LGALSKFHHNVNYAEQFGVAKGYSFHNPNNTAHHAGDESSAIETFDHRNLFDRSNSACHIARTFAVVLEQPNLATTLNSNHHDTGRVDHIFPYS